MRRSASLSACFLALLAFSACSSEPGSEQPAAGGSGGSGISVAGAGNPPVGGSASAGGGMGGSNSTSGSASVAGSAGTAGGGSGGSGGISGSGGSGGVAGSGGSGGVAGTSGGGGAGGSGGSGGSVGGPWAPTGPKKQWTCPPGPFGQQTMSAPTKVCDGFAYNYTYNEGPTWIASQHAFYFSNFKIYTPEGGDIIKYTPGQQCEVWQHDVGCNGLGVSPTGNVLAACHGSRAIMEYNVVTKVGRKIADMADGKMFDAPNDLIARSDGNIYFSNRLAENGNRPAGGLGEALIRIDPTGLTSVILKGGLNGVALSPDENTLSVCGMGTFPLDAAGVPGAKGQPVPGGDGIAMDCAGTISINATNSAYGGDDGKTLLIVGGGTEAKTVQTTIPGLP